MFTRILSAPNAFYKSQQRDEPDLSDSEKLTILEELFLSKPAAFLNRYKQFLVELDLDCFSNLENDYEIQVHLKEIRYR